MAMTQKDFYSQFGFNPYNMQPREEIETMDKENETKVLYVLVWSSRYGTEEIDQCDTLAEAKTLKTEYQTAYNEGTISIKMKTGMIDS